MRGLVGWLAKPREKLLVSLDWVDIRQFHCLVAAARLRGRAIPLVWGIYRYEDFYRSQNNIEYGLLIQIRSSERLSRWLLLLAFAYIVLVAVGLYAARRLRPGQWCSNNRRGECSLFMIGKTGAESVNRQWSR